MSDQIQTLQAAIEERAKKRLTRDLLNLAEMIHQHPILAHEAMPDLTFTDDQKKAHTHTLGGLFRYEMRTGSNIVQKSEFMREVETQLLGSYLAQEVSEVMEAADELADPTFKTQFAAFKKSLPDEA